MPDKPLKTRKWWFILYPESAPSDWVDIIKSKMIQFAVSPLHAFDKQQDGSLKKPHYHVMLYYGHGSTTYNHVLELTRSLNQPIPQPYDSFKGAFEYLSHKNDPDKYQYNPDEIKLYNGFVPPKSDNQGASHMKVEIIQFARDNQITEFSDLLDCLIDQGLVSWFDEVMSHSYAYVQYLRSFRFCLVDRADKEAQSKFQKDADFFIETQKPVDVDSIPPLL